MQSGIMHALPLADDPRGSLRLSWRSPNARASATEASASRAGSASNRKARGPRRPRIGSADPLKKFVSVFATTIPPVTSQWPPKYFVVACMTRSAPRSSGRCTIGAQVLSQTQIAPAACAISASAARSVIFSSGFEGVSTQTSFVLAAALSSPQRDRSCRRNHFESPAHEDFAQQLRHAVVSIDVRKDVIARAPALARSTCSRRPEPKAAASSPPSSMPRRARALAVRIVVARVDEPARVTAFGIALERRGKMDRGGHRARRRINGVSGVDR